MIKQTVYFLIGCLALALSACNDTSGSADSRANGTADAVGGNQAQTEAAKGLACGTDEAMAKFYSENPQAHDEAKALEAISPEAELAFLKHLETAAAKKQNVGKGLTSNPTYVIPVVFHVYGTSFSGKTVNNAIIQDALYKTNEDFQGQAADWNQVISQFVSVKDTLSIEFRLAKKDPSGNNTSGILYYSNRAGYGNGSGYDSQIAADAWDNYKYMNVYIQNDLYNDGVTTNSGVAWYPSTAMSNSKTARVVYNGAYLGTNTSENFRSVLTHEFGHWLNLAHTFQGGCSSANENYCSSSGDYICDTPQMDSSSIQGYNCLSQMTNWQNFMHYSDQYANFTQNQVQRMVNALYSSARSSLWTQSNLVATGVATGGGGGGGGSATALSNGVAQTGVSASAGQYAKFYIDVPSGATNLTVTTSGGSGDADLYVRQGAEPTDSTYDCRPYQGGNNESCSFTNPSAARWYINLKGYSNFSGVSVTASYTTSGGGGGGSSVPNACASESPETSYILQDNDAICVPNGSSSTTIRYFYIYVPSGSSSLSIKSAHGSGNGNVYYNASTWATSSSYTLHSANSGNTESITVSNPGSGYRYISVVGNPSGMALVVDVQ